MFSTKHIILIVISAVVTVLFFFFIKKIQKEKVYKMYLLIGIISELVKVFTFTIINEERLGGYLPKTDLPFHLCSIQIILILILVLNKKESVERFIISFMIPTCLIGAFAAIMIPTSSSLGRWPITIQYFTYHSVLISFALKFLTSKEYDLNIKDYLNCLKFLLVILFFAIYINSILYDGVSNINFMYIIKPPQDNLPYLNLNQGWFVYVLKYMALVFVCCSLVYIKPIINFFKSLKKKDETIVA